MKYSLLADCIRACIWAVTKGPAATKRWALCYFFHCWKYWKFERDGLSERGYCVKCYRQWISRIEYL